MNTIPMKKPPIKVPKPPSTLDAVAQAKWREIAPGLVRSGVLTRATMPLLETFCSAFSLWQEHSGKPAIQTIVNKNGYEWAAPSAAFTVSQKAFATMARSATLLGLSAAGIARQKKQTKKPDSLSRLLTPRIAE